MVLQQLYLYVCFSQFVKGGHRSGKVAKHQCCHGDTFYVRLEKDEMEKKLGELRSQDLDVLIFFQKFSPK